MLKLTSARRHAASNVLPELSHPKWLRRDKLTAINFANKGKSGYKRPVLVKLAVEEVKERLPVKKVSQLPTGCLIDSYASVYEAIVGTNDRTFAQLSKAQQQRPSLNDQLAAIDMRKFQLAEQQLLLADASNTLPAVQRPPVDDVSVVIRANAKLGRVDETVRALQLLQPAEVTTEHLNCLMNVYAKQNNLEMVANVFGNMLTGTSLDVSGTRLTAREPDTKSFGVMIKMLAANNRTQDAFAIYDKLKQRLQGPIPMQIYTSLLKACTRSGDATRAIRLFEYIKSSSLASSDSRQMQISERPDSIAYSQIIHACAKAGMVQKAFVYYDEMLNNVDHEGKRLVPLDSTFNALIYACANNIGRPQSDIYGYQRAFELSDTMQSVYGLQPSKVTYEYLLMACAQQGDVWRSKSLILQMQNDGVEVTSQAVMWGLASYAQLPKLITQLHVLAKMRKARREFDLQHASGEMGVINEQRAAEGKRPIALQDWFSEGDKYDAEMQVEPPANVERDQDVLQLHEYILGGMSPAERLQAMFDDSAEMLKLAFGGERQVTTHIINALLNVLGAFHRKHEAFEAYTSLFDKNECQRNTTSYLRILQHWFRPQPIFNELEQVQPAEHMTRQQLLDTAWRVYGDYESYRTNHQYPENWTELELKYVRNKWYNRGIGHQQRRQEYQILKYMVQGLAQCDQVDDAARLLLVIIKRGHAKMSQHQVDMHNPLVAPQQLARGPPPVAASDKNQSPISQLLAKITSSNAVASHESVIPVTQQSAPTAQFHAGDFAVLVTRARNLNRTDIVERVQQLLETATGNAKFAEWRADSRRARTEKSLLRRRQASLDFHAAAVQDTDDEIE